MKTTLICTTRNLIELDKNTKAPIAFRIWKAGVNRTDDHDTIFSKKSAKLLMDEQKTRGNLYSIDYDHLSLKDDRPATAGQAAGWHKLEVRDSPDGPELWATEVEWTKEAAEGITAKPPKWRYFSPAYRVDEETGEVTNYINTALCINPATHNNTQLANVNVRKLNMDALIKVLKELIDNPHIADKAKAMAEKLISALGGDPGSRDEGSDGSEEAAPESKEAPAMDEADEADESDEEDKKAVQAEADEEDAAEVEEAPPSSRDYKMKKTQKASTSKTEIEMATRVAKLEAELNQTKVTNLVMANLGPGKKIPTSMKSWALSQDLESLNSYLKVAPIQGKAVGVKEIKTATRGEEVTSTDSVEAQEIDKVLGLAKVPAKIGFEGTNIGGKVRFLTTTPENARKLLAKKQS